MKIIDGKKIAKRIRADLKNKIAKLEKKPSLAVILVGNDKASRLYVSLKKKASRELGIRFFLFEKKANISEAKIKALIEELNQNKNIDAILVQLPLPKNINANKIIKAIDPTKDADGFSAKGGHPNILKPVFPGAIMKLIKSCGKKLTGKKSVIIANSKIFGEVMKAMLKRENVNADYVLAKNFKKTKEQIKKADIVITACGRAGMIKGEMIKPGAIIIDGGIIKKGKNVFGDVNADSVKNNDGYLSPVPGGVGPVTVAMLMENVYNLAVNRKEGTLEAE